MQTLYMKPNLIVHTRKLGYKGIKLFSPNLWQRHGLVLKTQVSGLSVPSPKSSEVLLTGKDRQCFTK